MPLCFTPKVNMKRIPKSFEILGQTITVVLDPTLEDREGAYGVADFETNTMYLQPRSRKRKADLVHQTFWHEVHHFMLFFLGYEKLCDDEQLVDRLGFATHQVIKSAKFS